MKIDILGVPTDAQPFTGAIERLTGWTQDEAGRRYVCHCPAYTIMMCREQPAVMRAVSSADMVAADGMPVVWLQRRAGAPDAARVYGPDVMLALAAATERLPVSHFLWGGAPGVAEKLAEALRRRFPGLTIAGCAAPPYVPLGDQPDRAAVERLNASGAHIIWVGLGSPKQDLWMAQHRPLLNARLLMGVGAAFDLLSGERRQAPRWMQRSGLEWAFRLALEPRRLAKRYLIYNPKFAVLALRQYGLR